eukprot:3110968-Prymnesium_polylepis.1
MLQKSRPAVFVVALMRDASAAVSRSALSMACFCSRASSTAAARPLVILDTACSAPDDTPFCSAGNDNELRRRPDVASPLVELARPVIPLPFINKLSRFPEVATLSASLDTAVDAACSLRCMTTFCVPCPIVSLPSALSLSGVAVLLSGGSAMQWCRGATLISAAGLLSAGRRAVEDEIWLGSRAFIATHAAHDAAPWRILPDSRKARCPIRTGRHISP